MKIQNIDNLEANFIWKDKIGLITKELGAAAGSEKFYVNIDSVPPKAYSTKYHSHTQQEEFFFVLEGTGVLRLNNEETVVCKGSFIAKPSGKGLSHTFYNNGEVPLVILDVGTVEKEDTCYYPDEKMYMHRIGDERQVFHEECFDKTWEPEPNPSIE